MKWLSKVLPVLVMEYINYEHHGSVHMCENLLNVTKRQWDQMAFVVLSGEDGGKAGVFEPWFELCDACFIDMTNDLDIKFRFGSMVPNTTFELDENDGDMTILQNIVKEAMNRAKTHRFKHHTNWRRANEGFKRVVCEVTKMVRDGLQVMMPVVVDALDSGDIKKLRTWLSEKTKREKIKKME